MIDAPHISYCSDPLHTFVTFYVQQDTCVPIILLYMFDMYCNIVMLHRALLLITSLHGKNSDFLEGGVMKSVKVSI